MDEAPPKTGTIFLVQCPRLKIGIKLSPQTWEEHIKPFHAITDEHLPLIESVIKNCDEQQPVWYKERHPERMCIVKQVVQFLPENKFILVAILKYSEAMGCVTSTYPVDELPAKDQGYKLL